MSVRPPAVAGRFYPSDSKKLKSQIASCLQTAATTRPEADQEPPKAIIAPHAGYIYSGPIAASAYAKLATHRSTIIRVALLGPSHFVRLRGLAVPTAEVTAFRTPLGNVPLDRSALDALVERFPFVTARDDAHTDEHCLEVHLPFLQYVLNQFTLLPLVVGDASPEQTADVLESLWDSRGTLIVISSDLSHYHDYATAKQRDRRTAEAVTSLNFEHLTPADACGCYPIQGLLALAHRRGLTAKLLDLRNSGDTAGPRDRVVGYGAFALQ